MLARALGLTLVGLWGEGKLVTLAMVVLAAPAIAQQAGT